MSRKIFLVFSYCNTPEKVEVLSKNLDKIKSLGFESFLYSPISLPLQIQEKCNYFFLTQENPVDDRKLVSFWKVLSSPGSEKEIKISYLWRDSSWGGIYQIKTICHLAQFLNSDFFYIMAYDSILSDEVIEIIKSNQVNYCLPFGRRENGNLVKYRKISTQLICLDKKFIKSVAEEIDEEKYWECGEAEKYLEDFFNGKKEFTFLDDPLIEDSICNFDNYEENFFNFSPFDDFKLFFSKGPENIWFSPDVSLLFYGFSGQIQIGIEVNNSSRLVKVSSLDVINLGIKEWEIKDIKMWYKGEEFDLLPFMSKCYFGGIENQNEK